MKIRLTEGQYKRLLSEDNKSFLDGEVNFRNIGNKVDKFVVNCFEYLYRLNIPFPKYSSGALYLHVGQQSEWFMKEFGLTQPESTILAYNYIKFSKEVKDGDFKKVLGKPLEYYGKFTYNNNYPVTGYISGQMDVNYVGYGSSRQEFFDQLSQGEYDSYEDAGEIEYEYSNVQWEDDDDYAGDYISQQIDDADIDEVMDNIVISN